MGFTAQIIESPSTTTRQTMQWEKPGCLMGGGNTFDPIIEAPDPAGGDEGLWFLVVRCRECGLCFTNPRPAVEAIGQFYPSDYQPHLKTRGRLSIWRRCMDHWTRNYRKVL